MVSGSLWGMIEGIPISKKSSVCNEIKEGRGLRDSKIFSEKEKGGATSDAVLGLFPCLLPRIRCSGRCLHPSAESVPPIGGIAVGR